MADRDETGRSNGRHLQSAVQFLVAEAQEALAEDDFDAAVELVLDALALDEDYSEIGVVRAQLIESLVARAGQQAAMSEWETVLVLSGLALRLGDDPEARRFRDAAELRAVEVPAPGSPELSEVAAASPSRGSRGATRTDDLPEGSDDVDSDWDEIATFGNRLGAHLIDVAFWTVSGFIVALILGAVAPDDGSIGTGPTALALGFAFGLSWYFNSVGSSPGKKLVGIQIIRDDGEAPGGFVGLGRMLMALVSGAFLSLGYFWAAWDPETRTWHDHAAGTYVIRARSA